MTDPKQIEELRTFNKFYDLLLLWKVDKSDDAAASMKVLLDELGFWPTSSNEETEFTAPYFPNRLSFILSSPDEWNFGEFPVKGEYKFAIVYQNSYGEGERKWEIKVKQFSLEVDSNAYMYDSMSSYLYPFIENSEDLMLPAQRRMPQPDSPDYAKAKIQLDQEAKLRVACLQLVPEFTHHTWPNTLEFEGSWQEEAVDHTDFFKKTLDLISGEFHPVLVEYWDLEFETLKWNNDKASLTKEESYSIFDQNAFRLYGMSEWCKTSKETGIWLEKNGNKILYNVIRPCETVNPQYETKGFLEFSGEISSGKIKLNTISHNTKEGKEKIWNYFSKYGLSITNLP